MRSTGAASVQASASTMLPASRTFVGGSDISSQSRNAARTSAWSSTSNNESTRSMSGTAAS